MKQILLFALLALCGYRSFSQKNYYVSPSGSNANSGTLALPWQTIQYSLNHLALGDTLNAMAGTYSEKINIPVNGICLRKFKTDLPVIDAAGVTNQNPIIFVHNKSNVVIDGIELMNNIQADAQGILVDGSGSNITIKNCSVHDIHFSSNPSALVNAKTNAQGIIVYGNNSTATIANLKILNNKLYNCRLGYSEGIAVNGNVDGFEVSGNEVHNLTNIGIDLIGHEGTCADPLNDQARNGLVQKNSIHDCISAYASSGGIYIDGGKNIVVENNVSFHNGYGIEIGCENVGKTTDGIVVRSNIFYDNEICALALGGYAYPRGSGKVTNATFRNNTCYYNDFSRSGTGELYLSYSENSILENNVFYTTTQESMAYAELSQPTLSFNYNVFYCQGGADAVSFDWNGKSYMGLSDFQAGSGFNKNAVFGNPLFVKANVTNPDFHITAGSPCFSAGNPAFIPAKAERDIDGEARAEGTIDCGADEYYATTGFNTHTMPKTLLAYPNPASALLYVPHIYENAIIEIVNSFGQVVYKKDGDGKYVMDVSGLENGLYFLMLKGGDSVLETGKFVKE